MSHVLESQVPVADGQRAERLPQRWLLRLLCPGLSFPGQAPSFKLSLPLFCGLPHWGWGAGVAGPPRSEMGCFHLWLRGCFSNCGRSGLHGGPARGESTVVRITVGGPPSTAGSGTAPASCWGDLGQAGLLLAGLHPVHTQPLHQGGGFPLFPVRTPRQTLLVPSPRPLSTQRPRFTHSCPRAARSFLQGCPSLLGATECWPRGWSVRVQAVPSPCGHENLELEAAVGRQCGNHWASRGTQA